MTTNIDFNTVKLRTEDWVEEESGFDEPSKAFQALMVSLILNLDEDEARDSIVDGSHDRGIDAVYVDERAGRNTVHLFQFKYTSSYPKSHNNFPSSEFDKLISFVDDILNENPSLKTSVNPLLWEKVEQCWEAFAKPKPSIEVHFCANMNEPVDQEKGRIQASLKKYSWINLNYHGIESIVKFFIESKKSYISKSIKIVDKDYFERTDGDVRALIASVEANEICNIIAKEDDPESVNEAIFDENVRVYLSRSNPINKEIITTALSDDRRLFWYLNNGLTITCDSFSYPAGTRAPTVEIDGIQIVNGGQTSHALFEARKQSSDKVSDVLVLVRIIEAKKADIGSRISETTNSQTPINSRDLKANTTIQRKIEEALQAVDFYYERKSNQYAGKPKDRRIDSLAAGQAYLAYALDMPEVSKKDRGRIFGDLFQTIYSDEINPINLVTPFKIYSDIERIKKDLQKRIRRKADFIENELFLIDGAYHVLFAVKLLCKKQGGDIFDYNSAQKFIGKAIEIVASSVEDSKVVDSGFSFNRFFKDANTRTKIASRVEAP